MDEAGARDRLLRAAAELLEAAGGGEVSTRTICERAGVQAPTLYHHFGNKQGLLDAVVSHGFRHYLAGCAAAGGEADPIDEVRRGWDLHVGFGLENPSFYALIYGRAVPGEPCGVVADVEAMILAALQPAARAGRLRVSPDRAARQVLAASTGVVLTLIAQQVEQRDLSLSTDVRDAVLDRIFVPTSGHAEGAVDDGRRPAAVALAAALDQQPSGLTAAEDALLREWLGRLGETSPA